MFTRQAPLINNNLVQGGVSQPQASAITSAIGQCNVPLEHRAPVSVDITSPDMKLITSETATYVFPPTSMNPPEVPPPDIPDVPLLPMEELPPFEPDPFLPYVDPFPPMPGYYNDPTGGYPSQTVVQMLNAMAGKYLKAFQQGRTPGVQLNAKDDSDGNICTFEGGKIIKGITTEELMQEFEEHINNPDGSEEPGRERVLTVVTGIEIGDGCLKVSKQEGVYVLNAGGEATDCSILLEDCGDSGK